MQDLCLIELPLASSLAKQSSKGKVPFYLYWITLSAN